MPEFSWNNEIWRVYMISRGEWAITPGDGIIAGWVLILLVDVEIGPPVRPADDRGSRAVNDLVRRHAD
jgi:hypothetical protein